jgi:cytoskeletal protein CcmA (bactofilin family)
MAKPFEPGEVAVNRIVAGTTIKGNIETTSDFRFEGTLIGNLNTKGKLIIGAAGEVKGEVHCKNCDVEGKVEGKLSVSELLTLKTTSIILGDIVAKRLAIEPGAKFTGNCQMTNSDATQTETKTTAEKPIK